MKRSKPYSALCALCAALFSLTAAVAVPILWRGWYYWQIGPLGLVEKTGWSEKTIQGAFDAVMDFLVKGGPFSTGELAWSESGRSHFADCRVLFRLDFVVLAVTGALLLLFLIRALRAPREAGGRPFSPTLLALGVTAGLFLLFGIWAFVDFDSLFTAFHALCFPGKDNWIFDARTDQIIRVLPEVFWARTAGLVAGLTLAIEGVLALLDHALFTARTPKTVYAELTEQAAPLPQPGHRSGKRLKG